MFARHKCILATESTFASSAARHRVLLGDNSARTVWNKNLGVRFGLLKAAIPEVLQAFHTREKLCNLKLEIKLLASWVSDRWKKYCGREKCWTGRNIESRAIAIKLQVTFENLAFLSWKTMKKARTDKKHKLTKKISELESSKINLCNFRQEIFRKKPSKPFFHSRWCFSSRTQYKMDNSCFCAFSCSYNCAENKSFFYFTEHSLFL